MYIISELTGRIYLNGVEIPLDDSTSEFQQYLEDKDIIGYQYVSATESELAEIESKNLTERINKAFTLLRQRALASSIGKPISFGFDYIKEQSEQYTYKYEVAIGNIQDAFVNDMIDNEANDFGITPEQMRQLIIDRYLQGKGLFIAYTSMIERARTKALTMIEISDFDKAEQITLMMENVPTEMTLQDAEILTNQMLAI